MLLLAVVNQTIHLAGQLCRENNRYCFDIFYLNPHFQCFFYLLTRHTTADPEWVSTFCACVARD